MNKLDGLAPHVKAISCRIRIIAASLSESDREVFMNAINDLATWPARTLSNSLKQRGVSISDVSITRHRNGICTC